MVDEGHLTNRRSLLKHSSALVAATVAVSLPTAAEDDVTTSDYFGTGQDVITTSASYVYSEPTTSSTNLDTVFEGVEGQCQTDQVSNDGYTWVKVAWDDGTETGYVTTDVLDHTNQINPGEKSE